MLNFNNETYNSIPNYEGMYEVSANGVVRSVDRYLPHSSKPGLEVLRKGKVIKAHPSSTAIYLQVTLWKGNIPKMFGVHRLVALSFIPNPEGKREVNHIDGNKLNNNVCNLEWVTSAENKRHGWYTGLYCKETARQQMIGTRRSKHTAYRNVTWDKSRNKWKGSVKHKGKVLGQKRFNTAEEAALHVNWIISKYNLSRPLNVIK